MSKVVHIGICKNKGLPIIEVNSIEAVQGKGLIGDRKFKNNNDQKWQLTLIELENINLSGTLYPPLPCWLGLSKFCSD